MDYKELLKKYMNVIWNNEGAVFLHWCERDQGISIPELAELAQIELELLVERRN